MDKQLPVRMHGEVMQVDYADCILGRMDVEQIIGSLRQRMDRTPKPRLVLNLEDVAHLSSSALGMLVTLDKHARARGGQMRLCGLSPSIREVLQLTKLVEVLSIDASVEASLAHLQ
jgi:anti-anti-sigma factor